MHVKALQAQALQLMALGVAGAQTVVPVSGSPVLLTMPNSNTAQCSVGGGIKPTVPAAVMPSVQLQPTQTAQLPLLTSMPPILPKTTASLTTPTPTSIPAPPAASQDNINRQQLMEQLANSVTKNGGNAAQQDSDVNEELVEFMK